MLAATFGEGQVAYSFLWFFLFLIQVWLMFTVFVDVFRSDDLKGWAKAAWVLLVLALPLIGILAYLIVRGDQMRAHRLRDAEQRDDSLRRYLDHRPAPPRSIADELARLAELRDRGDIDADDYRRLKAKLIADHAGDDGDGHPDGPPGAPAA